MVMLEKEQRELAAQRQVQRFPRKKPRRRIGLWVGVLAVVALLAVGAVAVIVATDGDEPQPTLGIAGEPEALRELYNQMYPSAPYMAQEDGVLVKRLVQQGAIPAETLEPYGAVGIEPLQELYYQTHGSTIQPEPEDLLERLVQQGAIPAETLEPQK